MYHVMNLSDYDQVDPKYIRFSVSDCGRFTTAKYSKKAFFDQAWRKFPILEQARGHTFSTETGKILTRPFDKVFNFTENGAGLEFDQKTEIVAVEKINGFMGAITSTSKGFMIQTSGTCCNLSVADQHKNDYIRMLAEFVDLKVLGELERNYTYLFEVVHEKDPHIIPEKPGLYLIGMRRVGTAALEQEAALDRIAEMLDFLRPDWRTMTIEAAENYTQGCVTEGLMLREKNGAFVCKMKSKFYLNRKFLARLGKERSKDLTKITTDDEEVRAMLNAIIASGVSWVDIEEQERLDLLDKLVPKF